MRDRFAEASHLPSDSQTVICCSRRNTTKAHLPPRDLASANQPASKPPPRRAASGATPAASPSLRKAKSSASTGHHEPRRETIDHSPWWPSIMWPCLPEAAASSDFRGEDAVHDCRSRLQYRSELLAVYHLGFAGAGVASEACDLLDRLPDPRLLQRQLRIETRAGWRHGRYPRAPGYLRSARSRRYGDGWAGSSWSISRASRCPSKIASEIIRGATASPI